MSAIESDSLHIFGSRLPHFQDVKFFPDYAEGDLKGMAVLICRELPLWIDRVRTASGSDRIAEMLVAYLRNDKVLFTASS
jgi:hypothetical protein